MAKVKRSVLKEIVKECLLEILFEGIDSEPGYDEEPIREARQPKRRVSRPSRKKSLHAAVQEKNVGLKENFVDTAVNELTQDPMMAAIYADTAQTTLSEQKEGRRVVGGDAASTAVDSVDDMSQIFEGAGNWAAIAFSGSEK